MDIADNIQRIQEARNQIRDHLVSLGLANGDETIDELAAIVEGLGTNQNVDLSEIKLTPPTRTTYYIGDAFDTSGSKVDAIYNKDVTDKSTFSIQSGNVFDSAGSFEFGASYTEGGKTKYDGIYITVKTTAPHFIYGDGNVQRIESLDTLAMGSSTIYVDGKQIKAEDVKEVHLEGEFDVIPNSFCSYFQNLTVLDGMDGVTKIGNEFLCYCDNFNSELSLPSTLKEIGDKFLNNCKNFNKPIVIPEGVESVGDSFLYYLSNFNSDIILPITLKKAGNKFITSLPKFNSRIILPPGSISLGYGPISYCKNFNQPVTMPEEIVVTSTGATGSFSIFSDCMGMISPITFNCPVPNNITTGGVEISSFSTREASAQSYSIGYTFTGPYASDWKASFPDISGVQSGAYKWYRKINLA